jgi:hypothetical protein
MLTNAGLVGAIENMDGLASDHLTTDDQSLRKKRNIYFAFILYSTLALSAVRFAGVSFFFFPFRDSGSHGMTYSACGTSSNATSSGVSGGREM